MADDQTRDRAEAAVRACYSTWADSYHADYYADPHAYPPVHQDIVRRLLRESGARNVLDAGCGPASMLRGLTDIGLDLYGFDLTPEMVAEAQRVMVAAGLPPERVWQGSVAERQAFKAPAGVPERFDAAICFGVLPHVPAALDQAVIENLRDAVRPGGLVAIEARNQLFGLFTLNRYSYDLFLNELIRADEMRRVSGAAKLVDEALDALKQRFRMDLPPVRIGKQGEPGYDEVLSRTHNPLVLKDRFAAAGFNEVRIFFYHYHCLPPMLESGLPALFREQSLAMEDPTDWRGYFMASAFIVAGKRA